MVRVIRLGALVALVFLLTAGAARAEDPLFLGWTTLAPALTTEYDPSSENDCAAGRTRCVTQSSARWNGGFGRSRARATTTPSSR